jgi:hypothetical protein
MEVMNSRVDVPSKRDAYMSSWASTTGPVYTSNFPALNILINRYFGNHRQRVRTPLSKRLNNLSQGGKSFVGAFVYVPQP